MRKILILLSTLLMLGGVVNATNPDGVARRANARVYSYIDGVYSQLKYKQGMKRMKIETFRSAFYGYLNLLEHGKIKNARYLTVCDFSLSSNTNRLWLIDVRSKNVLINTLVAHGSATGEEFATHFSNTPESHQSSLGFYITSNTYTGNNGYSMRMHGLDDKFNSNALSRDVVMHGADYVSHNFIRSNKRLGRSWGCPSVSREMCYPIIDKIKDGTCLFIYHPSQSYLKSSFWLNNAIVRLPREADAMIAALSKNEDKATARPSIDIKNDEQKEKEIKIKEINEEKEIDQTDIDKSIMTITEYEEPLEIQKFKEQGLESTTISIPAHEVTPEMRANALKKKKVVRKIANIIHVGKTDNTTTE